MTGDASSGAERPTLRDTKSVLPAEQSSYFAAINAKHFDSATAVGSRFTDAKNLEELLNQATSQRGSLDGDDRNDFIRMGVSPDALMANCRYLKVNTPGEVGIISVRELPAATTVQVLRTKEDTPCSLVVERDAMPTTDFGTIIIGPNEKEKPDDPEPSTKEMVWTVHPGPPVRPANEDIWPEGSRIPLQEVISQLGDGVYLNVRKVDAQAAIDS